VLRALGEGSHGKTFLARDERDGREVVMKALHAGSAGPLRLLQEARMLGAVRHPNVIEVRAVEQEGDQVLLVLEHVAGGSLRDALRQGPLPPERFCAVADGLLQGLQAVHAAGLVHRDVKPGNVLLDAHGTAKLADFGVARMPGAETTMVPGNGDAVGTVRYMSPEQARGKQAGPRSDLYSAAATLYEAWTGQPLLEPRDGESAIELQLRAAASRPFRRPLRGHPALRAWFARALHPLPSRRFPDAAAMRAALLEALAAPVSRERS
jgi:serine/threonine-protein kinase